jgi:Domain of unknown function (DUF4382)
MKQLMRKSTYFFFLLAMVATTVIYSCRKENEEDPLLELTLIDAPTDFQEVNIQVIGAEVKVKKALDGIEGWRPLTVQSGIINILSLTNGVEHLLSSTRLPVGDIGEIRLKLGQSNTVKVMNVIHVLNFDERNDSASLKLEFKKKIVAGTTYRATLDFDADKSIKVDSSNRANVKYHMKPKLRLITDANNGSIRGELTGTCGATIQAIRGVDTVSTFPTAGKFLLPGLASGTYAVHVKSQSPCRDTTIQNVKVEVGKATELGKIKNN